MAGLDQVVWRNSLLAHPAGHACVVSLGEACVATGGGDGEIAFHSSNENQLVTTAHRRVHKGAVTCVIRLSDLEVLSAGEDGAVYVSRVESERITSELIYRATLPVKRLSWDREMNRVLMYGDEKKLLLLDYSSRSVVASSDIISSPICAIAVFSSGFIVADMAGKVMTRSRDNLAEMQSKVVAGSVQLAGYCELFVHRDVQYFLCCPANGLFVGTIKTLDMVDHIRPPNAMDFALTQCGSVSDNFYLCHSLGITPINGDSLELSSDSAFPIKGIRAIDSDSDGGDGGRLLVMDSDGNLNLVTVTMKRDPRNLEIVAERTSNPLEMFDSSEDDKVHRPEIARQLTKANKKKLAKKRSRHDMMDDGDDDDDDDKSEAEEKLDQDEYEFDDYDVHEGMNNENEQNDEKSDGADLAEDNFSSSKHHGASPLNLKSIHSPFQPSSTPLIHGYRTMCWNSVGIISSRQDAGYNSIEVEFHDKSFHRPIRFIDEVGYTMGAVGKAGAIFASEKVPVEARSSKIYVSPVDSVERTNPWTTDLPTHEGVVGVAIGGASVTFPIVVATDEGFLRTFSMNGLQGPITTHPGKLIAMTANDGLLFLVHSQEWTNELSFCIYKLDGMEKTQSGSLGGRFQRIPLSWIGLSAHNIAGAYDESGMLQVLNPVSGTWQPWLDCHEQYQRGGRVWPIAFTMQDLLCLVLRASEKHPEAVPRPLQMAIPLRMPLVGIPDDSLVQGYERVLRTKIMLGSALLRPTDLSERESKKLQVVADKHVLELIQLAVKADKPARVLELCGLFQLEKSWEMAVQLVRHNRFVQLADRIEALKATLNQDSLARSDVETTARLVQAPRLPKRIAVESPGTSLTHLTPLVDHAARTVLPSSTPSKRAASVLLEAADTKGLEALPFARMSFESSLKDGEDQNKDPTGDNAPERSFVDMLKSVKEASTGMQDRSKKAVAQGGMKQLFN